MTIEEENKQLRLLLFFGHRCSHKYGDDGEMQCNKHRPFIDFKRDPVEHLSKAIFEHSILDRSDSIRNQRKNNV